MNTRRFLAIPCLLAALACAPARATAQAPANPREFEMKDGDTTYVMRRYVMVLLHRNKKAKKIPQPELDSIMAGHMANIGRLAKEGKLLVAGPMGDDTDLRGIFILDVGTIEEAEALVKTDPAVAAGRLRAECHPWWTAKGDCHSVIDNGQLTIDN